MANITCLRSSANGSCPRPACEGSLFCEEHSDEASRIAGYIIADEETRSHFQHHQLTNAYSLRQEVVLLRAMINERLNFATTPAEKIVAHKQIGDWLSVLDKMVNSLNRLDKETNQVLTKDTLMKVARSIVEVISDEVKNLPGHEQVIDSIANRLVPIIESAANVKAIK